MNKPLAEKYRPGTWAEVVGQDKALARLSLLRSRGGLAGRAFWITGKSGTGKTTIARLIAAEVAGSVDCIQELDALQLTPARLSELEQNALCVPFWAQGNAYIINEAHGLRDAAIRQLLVWLERLTDRTVVIFTTTRKGEADLFEDCSDASPLLSRCVELPLEQRDISKAFARRAQEIALAEGLDGKPLAAYERLVSDNRCNLRAVLQAIDAGAMME